MTGFHSSTMLATIVDDPKPFCTVKGGETPIGCDIRICINQTDYIEGQWKTHARFITLSAWYDQAKRLMSAKWCRKGYHAIFVCTTKECVYNDRNNQPTKKLEYKIIAAQPVLLSSDYSAQKKARYVSNYGPEHPTQDSPQSADPSPNSNQNPPSEPLEDEDIPF